MAVARKIKTLLTVNILVFVGIILFSVYCRIQDRSDELIQLGRISDQRLRARNGKVSNLVDRQSILQRLERLEDVVYNQLNGRIRLETNYNLLVMKSAKKYHTPPYRHFVTATYSIIVVKGSQVTKRRVPHDADDAEETFQAFTKSILPIKPFFPPRMTAKLSPKDGRRKSAESQEALTRSLEFSASLQAAYEESLQVLTVTPGRLSSAMHVTPGRFPVLCNYAGCSDATSQDGEA
ncbi:unnamed protein product [Pleuronectes platessa]|uniref:Uncharacterized protein n=1 Tax=Pleuronectes platessa TaxID=8262 RepID=A0A9N7V3C9_PLEPL|nr:unnamed protein product [Pleuronectes platessa]